MLNLPAYLLGRALAPIIRPALRWLDTAVVPALDIDWDDLGDDLPERDWLMEWEFPGDEP